MSLRVVNGEKGETTLVNESGQIISPSSRFYRSKNFFQPLIDYSMRLDLIQRNFPGLNFISAEDFQMKAEKLIKQIQKEPSLANLLKGIWLPICLPQVEVKDHGRFVVRVVLPALASAYPRGGNGKKVFCKEVKGPLEGYLRVNEQSRHQDLIDRMENDSVVGIMFFPLISQLEDDYLKSLLKLPPAYLLGGVIDSVVTVIAYPELLQSFQDLQAINCKSVAYGNPNVGFQITVRKKRTLLLQREEIVFKKFSIREEIFSRGSLYKTIKKQSAGVLYIG